MTGFAEIRVFLAPGDRWRSHHTLNTTTKYSSIEREVSAWSRFLSSRRPVRRSAVTTSTSDPTVDGWRVRSRRVSLRNRPDRAPDGTAWRHRVVRDLERGRMSQVKAGDATESSICWLDTPMSSTIATGTKRAVCSRPMCSWAGPGAQRRDRGAIDWSATPRRPTATTRPTSCSTSAPMEPFGRGASSISCAATAPSAAATTRTPWCARADGLAHRRTGRQPR